MTTATTTLVLQLPPNIAQQLQAEAQKQNTTLEKLALKSIQKDYGNNLSHSSTPTSSIVNFFIALRDGIQTGQLTMQIPVDETNLQMAESFKRNGTLLDFQASDKQLTLQLNPNLLRSPSMLDLSSIDLAELDPETAKIVEDFRHEDATIRYQAIQKVAQRYGQQS